jgi:hypothetical protein
MNKNSDCLGSAGLIGWHCFVWLRVNWTNLQSLKTVNPFFHIGDKILKRKSVMSGDEINAGQGTASGALVQVRTARNPMGKLRKGAIFSVRGSFGFLKTIGEDTFFPMDFPHDHSLI